MKKPIWIKGISVVVVLLLLSSVIFTIGGTETDEALPSVEGKINGVNFVAPSDQVSAECMQPLSRINSEWVALNPYCYGKVGDPNIYYDLNWQWWGERTEGTRKLIEYAKAAGVKVLIKPHIWVRGQGWGGDFELDSDEKWAVWEADFEDYILAHARLAAELDVEMFCIGTELRKSVQQRPQFWNGLIQKVRAIYSGKLTYASNWDNYQNVTFWDQLDYIGIDSYFPLSEEVLPKTTDLLAAWEPHKADLKKMSAKHSKPIIFTEFGYRSIDRTAWRQWELPEHWEPSSGMVNLQAQENAYTAIFQSFWGEEWFAGGFLWKWYPKDEKSGGADNRDYTPQNKPVEKLIKTWYTRS